MKMEFSKPLKINKDPVHHPNHYVVEYCGKTFEAVEVIEALNLNFNLGNAFKYIWRMGKKDEEIQELEKAAEYIRREIQKRKNEKTWSTRKEKDEKTWIDEERDLLTEETYRV